MRLANNPCANQTLIPVSIINCTNSSRLQFYEDTVYISIAGILGYIAGSFLLVVTGARIIMCKHLEQLGDSYISYTVCLSCCAISICSYNRAHLFWRSIPDSQTGTSDKGLPKKRTASLKRTVRNVPKLSFPIAF